METQKIQLDDLIFKIREFAAKKVCGRKDLVNRKRRAQSKCRHDYAKRSRRSKIDHVEISAHRPKRRSKQAAGAVGMGFAWFQNWLFPDHAFAINGFNIVERIENFPMASGKLYRILAVVFDRHMIRKGIMDLVIFEVRAFKSRSDRNFNTSCDL